MKSFLDALSNSGPAVRRYGEAALVTKGNHVRLQDEGVPQTDTAIMGLISKASKALSFQQFRTHLLRHRPCDDNGMSGELGRREPWLSRNCCYKTSELQCARSAARKAWPLPLSRPLRWVLAPTPPFSASCAASSSVRWLTPTKTGSSTFSRAPKAWGWMKPSGPFPKSKTSKPVSIP